MILRIYQTGCELPHWIGHPTHLGTPVNVPTPIQIVCEDRGSASVRFTGHLLVEHSGDGRKSCVNVLLNTSRNPDPNQPARPSLNPDPAPRSLCVPLPPEAVSRLSLIPDQPQRFELRLNDVHIAFGPPSPQVAPIRSARSHQFKVLMSALPSRALTNPAFVSDNHARTACQVALGQ
jgi:hypothetical protein